MKSVPQPQLSHNQMVEVRLTVNIKQSPNAIQSSLCNIKKREMLPV